MDYDIREKNVTKSYVCYVVKITDMQLLTVQEEN